jgi:hypothetical protein
MFLECKIRYLWCQSLNKSLLFFAFGFPEVTSHKKVTARDIDTIRISTV